MNRSDREGTGSGLAFDKKRRKNPWAKPCQKGAVVWMVVEVKEDPIDLPVPAAKRKRGPPAEKGKRGRTRFASKKKEREVALRQIGQELTENALTGPKSWPEKGSRGPEAIMKMEKGGGLFGSCFGEGRPILSPREGRGEETGPHLPRGLSRRLFEEAGVELTRIDMHGVVTEEEKSVNEGGFQSGGAAVFQRKRKPEGLNFIVHPTKKKNPLPLRERKRKNSNQDLRLSFSATLGGRLKKEGKERGQISCSIKGGTASLSRRRKRSHYEMKKKLQCFLRDRGKEGREEKKTAPLKKRGKKSSLRHLWWEVFLIRKERGRVWYFSTQDPPNRVIVIKKEGKISSFVSGGSSVAL